MSSLNSAGASPENATPESTHIPLPPQELEPTEIYANSIVHNPYRRFINLVGIYTALAWRNKAFGYAKYAEWAGKLKIKAYWTKGDDAISNVSA